MQFTTIRASAITEISVPVGPTRWCDSVAEGVSALRLLASILCTRKYFSAGGFSMKLRNLALIIRLVSRLGHDQVPKVPSVQHYSQVRRFELLLTLPLQLLVYPDESY